MSDFVVIEDCPVTTIESKSVARLKECLLHDKTGTIPISLWNDHIASINVSGVYKITNVTIKQHDSEFYLSTNSDTHIVTLQGSDLVERETTLKLIEKIAFPLASVVINNTTRKCPRCNMSVTTNSSDYYFRCNHCRATAQFASVPVQRIVEVISTGSPEVTIYPYQLQQYMQEKHDVQVVSNEDDICDKMLLDNTSVMLVNRRNICVTFE